MVRPCVADLAADFADHHVDRAVKRRPVPVRRQVQQLVAAQYRLYNEELMPALARQGIRLLAHGDRNARQRAWVRDYFEREVDDAVAALSSLLEPIIIVFLGVVIGGLVVAMYLPIFKLGAVV